MLPEIDRHQVLHFAAHAHVEQEVAQLSAILLANGQSLSVADMVGQGLAAELVVLSACDTGTGSLTDGDEVVGLTRGLFAAGARQAVVSLWPVNDLTTCLLMRRFYQRLADMSVAGALGQARRELVALTLNQQVDELVALQEELAEAGSVPGRAGHYRACGSSSPRTRRAGPRQRLPASSLLGSLHSPGPSLRQWMPRRLYRKSVPALLAGRQSVTTPPPSNVRRVLALKQAVADDPGDPAFGRLAADAVMRLPPGHELRDADFARRVLMDQADRARRPEGGPGSEREILVGYR